MAKMQVGTMDFRICGIVKKEERPGDKGRSFKSVIMQVIGATVGCRVDDAPWAALQDGKPATVRCELDVDRKGFGFIPRIVEVVTEA